MMELQTILVLCGLGVTILAVLLLMGLFSASGTSYEDAIAQQRKATTELLALAENKNKSKKPQKKANKKQAKREKRELGATGSEPESEAPAESGVEEEIVPQAKHHVEFCPPVVVDVPADIPHVKIRKRGKNSKVKPILINKEDPSIITDPSNPPSPSDSGAVNHFEEIQPKDDFMLLHDSLSVDKTEVAEEVVDKKEAKPSKAKGKQAKPAPEAVKEDSVKDQSPKEQRKAKKNEKKVQNDAIEVEEVSAAPPPVEVEKVVKVTAPVQKQAPSPVQGQTKNKKKKQEPDVLALIADGGVNVNELVRLVKEASLSRHEIQIVTDALLNKQHDPLPQHSEWSEGPNDPIQKMKRQLADKEKALADEVEASQALHAKLKELRGSLNAERSRSTALSRAMEESSTEVHTLQARLQRVMEDNQALMQDKMVVVAQSEALQVHLAESEQARQAQMSAAQAEAAARANDAHVARMDADALADQLRGAQHAANDLALRLQDADRIIDDLHQQRQAAQHEARQLQERLTGLSELQNEVQRLTSRAQTAESNVERMKEEVEKQKQQMSSEINSLREQLAQRESELAEAKQMKVAAPAQNGLPPASDKYLEISKVESMVASLKDELSAALRSNQDQKDQVAKLREQLTQYQDKNNDLRTKNWKVMEALQSAEKALQARQTKPARDSLDEALAKSEAAHYAEVASILREACPSIVPQSTPNKSWVDAFANKLKGELNKTNDSQDLVAQNEHLQGLVDKYKSIIDDTEGVLSRLQSNVTAEEQRWAHQLADKQRELDELRQRTVTQEPLAFAYACIEKSLPNIIAEMQNKIDSLQDELSKAQHNHSFADSERSTEERLFGELSAKRKLDNGPSHVSLEEK